MNSESENIEFKERHLSKGISQMLFPLSDDSLPFYSVKSVKQIVVKKSINLRILSPEINTRYNGKSPFGWNDGAIIPNKGLQSLISTGIYLKTKHFVVQLRPEVLLAQNLQFQTFPENYSDRLWSVRYFFYNETDLPEKYSKIRMFYPGQSYIKFTYRSIATGVSSENRWWGPGKTNSLLMSNSAPGFAHFFIQTEKPIKSKIGSFEFQLIAGNLRGSGEFPPDTNRTNSSVRLYSAKPLNANRYINGLAITYQPVFVKGLFLGIGRVFYLYEADRRNTLDGYLPVLGALLKNETHNEDQKKRDQLFSIFVKQVFDKGRSDIYIEFGRNDHAWNLRDFISDPFHSRAYIVGINKQYQLPKES
ncbi:MAG: capsule assembly Wzi family protein [Lacibacter sp.]